MSLLFCLKCKKKTEHDEVFDQRVMMEVIMCEECDTTRVPTETERRYEQLGIMGTRGCVTCKTVTECIVVGRNKDGLKTQCNICKTVQ